jgi:hypothetical protein
VFRCLKTEAPENSVLLFTCLCRTLCPCAAVISYGTLRLVERSNFLIGHEVKSLTPIYSILHAHLCYRLHCL